MVSLQNEGLNELNHVEHTSIFILVLAVIALSCVSCSFGGGIVSTKYNFGYVVTNGFTTFLQL